MIKSINASSEWLHVDGNRPYIMKTFDASLPEDPIVGQVHYDFALQELKVYNGEQWCVMEGHANIGLSGEMELTLHWARRKMYDEQRLDELCDKYPALADAREQFEAMKVLVDKHG